MSHPKIRESGEVVVLLARDHEGGQVGRVDGQEHHRKQRPDARHKSEHFLIASVPDPWHFGVDPDLDTDINLNIFFPLFLITRVPDPWHFVVWIRIRGSMPLTNGSGSGFDPDPVIFVIDLQDKKLIFTKRFCAYNYLKVHLHHFSKIKSPKEVAKQ